MNLNVEYYYYLNLYLDFNKQQKDKKDDPDHDKEEAKKEREAFFAPFPPAIRQRIELSSHATHISSTILGQHGTPAPGIAPLCTALNIPISFANDDFISPINLTHAINTAWQWGANIIHIAACHPTQTGVAPDLFARAVKQCQDNNMLIVAPGGNDKGECWCIPSILPGAVNMDGAIIPANPYDSRQMVDYLSANPTEAKPLIWTLNQELTPIYALEPVSGFAADIYETLIAMLEGQIQPEDSDDFVERVSIPARLTDRTVELFSGQVVPVITLTNTRGMYGWKVNSLVDMSMQTVITEATPPAQEMAMRKALSSFLNRVYYDLRNLGQFAKDRALNFSVTNAFQAASSFSQAISTGMQLDSIEVEKSPFCRINSDCWDVKLKFFDPENGRRAKKVYLFTIDVSDRIPVTLGQVRSWSVRK